MTLTRKDRTRLVQTQIKNPDLVERRRAQIVDATLPLFIKQGFHKTTTRQIAKAAGFSIGTLYEYVACKEDVLYLVCAGVHDHIERAFGEALSRVRKGKDALAAVVREFIAINDAMADVYLLMYQETHALPPQWRAKVLDNESRITDLICRALREIAASGEIGHLGEQELVLLAHNISVMGHMWVFRRWSIGKRYSLEEYIALQTAFVFGMVGTPGASSGVRDK